LALLIKRDGYVIGSRVGETPASREVAIPAAESLLDGFITETQTQVAGYNTHVMMRAIPLMALEPLPCERKQRNSSQPLRVAYLGRYERPKGIFRLIDIWREASPPNAELAFYGMGPHRRELEHYIAQHSLEGVATVNDGWTTTEQQAAILAAVDLLILPSDSEGFPLVLLEAMAHGVPFVATDVGGVRELANPDVAVVPLDNVALSRALQQMLGRIRSGGISAERLQRFYRDRYSPQGISEQWRAALLEPEKFWGDRQPRASTQAMK
jgi:glycosyltransferase involved in cell wall biosynthesis